MNERHLSHAVESFKNAYGKAPETVIRAPGRVNIIGEHTDYLGGLCMPMAIDLSLYVAASKTGGELRIVSELYPLESATDVTGNEGGKFKKIAALRDELEASGFHFDGADIGITGDLPSETGLASSAALIGGVLFALCELYEFGIGLEERAKIAVSAEHRAGTPCGYMDPAAVIFGEEGTALYLDCYHEEFERFVADTGDYSWLVIDSGKTRSLADGGYAELKNAMDEAAKSLSALDERITHPRILDFMNYLEGREGVEERHRRYLDHYYLENERVKSVRRAFEYGNVWQAGNILYDAHESMKTLLGAGSPETDWLVERLGEIPDVLGARMTGAGFGGSVVALVKSSSADLIAEDIAGEGKRRFWKEMKWHKVKPSGGAEKLL